MAGGITGSFGAALEEAKKVPPIVWIGVVGVGAYLLIKQQQNSSGTTPTTDTTSGDSSTGQPDPGSVPGDGSTTPLPPTPSPTPTPKPPSPTPKPPAHNPPRSYRIKSGDTLDSIASHLGVSETDLYSENENIIEATARQHGFGSSDNGHWIFPGETLSY